MVEHAPGTGVFEHGGVTAHRGSIEGAAEGRIGIVVARFNAAITERLFAGAVDALTANGVATTQIDAVQVPGSVEIPIAARTMIERHGVSAVVALGCVIRGETAHFDYVCSAVVDGCLRVSLDTEIPVAFGVITANTREQAEARSRRVGADAAMAALEMAALLPSR